jgi:hypothetical protein
VWIGSKNKRRFLKAYFPTYLEPISQFFAGSLTLPEGWLSGLPIRGAHAASLERLNYSERFIGRASNIEVGHY